jgi:hypothetical protein
MEEEDVSGAQDHEGRSTCKQMLYYKEGQGTLLQIIGHDGVQFFRSTAHQLDCKASVGN